MATAKPIKMLLIGEPGTGKTGSLASLAQAGYNIRVLDCDNGTDILGNMLADPKGPYGPEARQRVTWQTVKDKMKLMPNGSVVPVKPSVWARSIELLQNWPELGHVETWTQQDVLVIDSLTRLSKGAFNWVLALNARLGKRPEQSDYGTAQGMIDGVMEMLVDDSIPCNVIVISHIRFIEEDSGPSRGYPNTIGKALPRTIGSHFNSILMTQKSGTGSSVKRKIYTHPIGMVELKNSNPYKVQKEYPLESGLADYFRDVQQAPVEAAGSKLVAKAAE